MELCSRSSKISEAKRYLAIRKAGRNRHLWTRLQAQDFVLPTGLVTRALLIGQRIDLARLSVPALVHTKIRTSMTWSREIRLPFLDYRFVQLLLSLGPGEAPGRLDQGGVRKAMESYLPKSIVWRKDKQASPFLRRNAEA